MNTERATILSLTLTFLIVGSAIPFGNVGLVGTASADHHGGETFTLSQPGTSVCYEVDTFTHDHEKMVPEVEKRGSIPEDYGDVTGPFKAPGWDGPVTIESIMDYRYRNGSTGQTSYYAPYLHPDYRWESWEDGTYGMYNWSDNNDSHLWFYENANGEVSLVVRHDKLYENVQISSHAPYNGEYGSMDGFFEPAPGSGEASWEFDDLPDGEWAYIDDMYPKPRMDDYYVDGDGTRYGHREADYVKNGDGEPLREFEGGYFSIDWSWDDWTNSNNVTKHGTDGGAYRGFHNLAEGESVTITNSFSGDVEEWEVRNNDETTNDDQLDLVMGEPLVIERGANCLDASIDADPNPAEIDQDVTFTAPDGADEYRWDFDGDGEPETNTSANTASHAYDSAGDKQVSVTVVEGGETTSATTTVEVGADQPPTAAFAVEDDVGDSEHHVVGESLRFNGSASSDNVGVSAYEWTIDGTERTGERVDHSFSSPGDKEVTLSVTDSSGKADDVTKTVTIVAEDDPEAAASARPDEVEAGAPITFDGTASSDERGELVSYEWDLDGDGEPDETGPRVEGTYDTPGEKSATLTVTDNNGNTDATNLAVSVSEPSDPVIESTDVPPEVSVSGDFEVSANATDAGTNGSELIYEWTFTGGGNSAEKSGQQVSHSFDDQGSATVELVVEDAAGRTNSTGEIPVDVTGMPNAALSADPADADVGDTVTLDASNSTDDGTIVRYDWNVDGDDEFERNTTDNATIDTTYDSSGTYDATVRVVDDDGSTANATVAVEVESNEQAQSGGSGGGGGSVSLGPPPVLTETEQVGPNEAAIDVRNVRGDEAIQSDLPASEIADDTGVTFRNLALNVGGDEPHVVVRAATSADAPENVPALTGSDATDLTPPDETLAYLDLGADYVDSGVENATVTFAVQRSALGEYADASDVTAYGYDGSWTQLDAEVVESSDDAYRLEATVDGLGALAVGATDGLGVTDVGLANDSVTTGEAFEASASVENGGSTARTATVNLTLSGSVVASETVEIAPGDAEQVTLSGEAPTPGSYEIAVGDRSAGTLTVEEADPADLSVTDVSLNSSTIEAGESVEIRATVENAGDLSGERTVALTMFGEQLATETVEVGPDAAEQVSFVREVDAAGSYEVDVDGETATLDVESADGGDGIAPNAPGVPGFGVGVAVVALLAALLAARTRR